MDFGNYALRKTSLDIGLKCHVSEDPSSVNKVNAPKHCCNVNDSNVTIFSGHFEGN